MERIYSGKQLNENQMENEKICSNYTYKIGENSYSSVEQILDTLDFYETINTRLTYAHDPVAFPNNKTYNYDMLFRLVDPDGYDEFCNRQYRIAINDLQSMIADAVAENKDYCEYEDLLISIVPKNIFPYSVRGYFGDGGCFMTAGCSSLEEAVATFFSEPEVQSYFKEQIKRECPCYNDEQVARIFNKKMFQNYDQIKSTQPLVSIVTNKGEKFTIERR